MRKLLIMAGLLFSIASQAQVGELFGGTANVFAVDDNTGPQFIFRAFFNEAASRWTGDSTQVGDHVFVFSGNKVYKLTVDSILSASTIVNLRVRDSTGLLASFPTGVIALMRLTDNNQYPATIPGIPNVLASKITTYFAEQAENATSGGLALTAGDKGDIDVIDANTWTVDTSAINSTKLASNAVTTDKITDLNVTTGKLADTAVTTAKVTDLNITTGKLADTSITTIKLRDLNVTTAKIAEDAVTNAKLDTMAANTIKANLTGSTANPTNATIAQVRTALTIEDSTSNKLVVPSLTSPYFLFATGSRTATTANSYLSKAAGALLIDAGVGFRFGSWITANRPASPGNGESGYNSTLHLPDYYINGAWRNGAISDGALTSTHVPYINANGHLVGSTGLRLVSGVLTVDNGPSGDAITIGNNGFLNWGGTRIRAFSGVFNFTNSFTVNAAISTNSSNTFFSMGAGSNVGIGINTPQRKLHVAGEVRIDDLTTTTPTKLIMADADGVLSGKTPGFGIKLASDGTPHVDTTKILTTSFGGSSTRIRQVAHGFTAPEAVFWNGVEYETTTNVYGDTIRCSGIVVEVFTADSFRIQFSGYYANDFSLPEGMYYATDNNLSLTKDTIVIPAMLVENGYSVINPIVEDEKQALEGELITLETATGSYPVEVGGTVLMHWDSLVGRSYAALFSPSDTLVMTGSNYYTVGDWNTAELATSDWTKRDTALVYTGTNGVVFKVTSDVCYRIWPDNIATDDTYEVRLMTGTGVSPMSRRYKEVPVDGYTDCVTMTAFYTGNNSGSNALIRVSIGSMPGEVKFLGGSLVVERL